MTSRLVNLLKSVSVARSCFASRYPRLLMLLSAGIIFAATISPASAQAIVNHKNTSPDAFRQLDEVWPTANSYRTASGAPGHEYWQQKVDYDIDVELHDDKRQITGSESVTYTNNSPDALSYLWFQLDANRFHPNSNANRHHPATSLDDRITFGRLNSLIQAENFPGGT